MYVERQASWTDDQKGNRSASLASILNSLVYHKNVQERTMNFIISGVFCRTGNWGLGAFTIKNSVSVFKLNVECTEALQRYPLSDFIVNFSTVMVKVTVYRSHLLKPWKDAVSDCKPVILYQGSTSRSVTYDRGHNLSCPRVFPLSDCFCLSILSFSHWLVPAVLRWLPTPPLYRYAAYVCTYLQGVRQLGGKI